MDPAHACPRCGAASAGERPRRALPALPAPARPRAGQVAGPGEEGDGPDGGVTSARPSAAASAPPLGHPLDPGRVGRAGPPRAAPRRPGRRGDGPPGPAPRRCPPSVGDAGRYQLHGEIARGGMGVVLKGRDVDLGRDVAVKVLLEKHRDSPEMVRRFVEEAQIAGQLQHPGIVPVYELGRLPDARLYIAMKLIRGRTLAALLDGRADAAEDRPRYLAVFEQVCQTMAYAHACGVIHRDLKPSNVMVGSFGEVQVMDWGLAKVLDRGGVADEERSLRSQADADPVRTLRTGSTADESRAGSVLGTPSYMAPEQARGRLDTLDERADVFGLGAILCEILTGLPPYTAPSGDEVYRKAARADLAEALARLDACGAEAELVALAKSCLAAAPRDRPRDAGVVVAALTAHLAGVQERLKAAELARARAESRAAEERKRRLLVAGLAASLLALAALGGGGGLWLTRQRAARVEAADREATDGAARGVPAARPGPGGTRGRADPVGRGDPGGEAGRGAARPARGRARPAPRDPGPRRDGRPRARPGGGAVEGPPHAPAARRDPHRHRPGPRLRPGRSRVCDGLPGLRDRRGPAPAGRRRRPHRRGADRGRDGGRARPVGLHPAGAAIPGTPRGHAICPPSPRRPTPTPGGAGCATRWTWRPRTGSGPAPPSRSWPPRRPRRPCTARASRGWPTPWVISGSGRGRPPCCGAPSGPTRTTSGSTIDLARSLMGAGQPDEAVRFFSAAVAIRPRSELALSSLGEALRGRSAGRGRRVPPAPTALARDGASGAEPSRRRRDH